MLANFRTKSCSARISWDWTCDIGVRKISCSGLMDVSWMVLMRLLLNSLYNISENVSRLACATNLNCSIAFFMPVMRAFNVAAPI